jgi:adenine-specific DNA-methyltransferase
LSNSRELEREIDKIVYELYGLSEEEIRMIEGEIK